MGKGLRLTEEEKKLVKNLDWFTLNKIKWVGEKDKRKREAMLKDLVKDNGHYAVFSINDRDIPPNSEGNKTDQWVYSDPNLDDKRFDNIVVVKSEDEARNIVEWDPLTHALVIDIKWMDFIYEVRKPDRPHFFRMGAGK